MRVSAPRGDECSSRRTLGILERFRLKVAPLRVPLESTISIGSGFVL
jgi:hypothetical protein